MGTTQRDEWQGPALFSLGFRPFFLAGALWAILSMVLWLGTLSGTLTLPTRFDAVSWHGHAFLFGYLGAILAGFLLTAVPNWTGRRPITGWPLAALLALWLAGRVAVATSGMLPPGLAMAVDLAFPLVLGAMILHEIMAGRNWRNLIILALLAAFTLANGLFHVEGLRGGVPGQGIGLRLGVGTAVMMIALVGGRIIPSFTGNWLARTGHPARPAAPMQRFDKLVLVATAVILVLWIARPLAPLTGGALIAMGALHLARQMRWHPRHTLKEPLVWVLHLSYAFIPMGAIGLGIGGGLGHPGTAAAQHLWMLGAIGAMTLAVMTRATLGHTGKPLTADARTVGLYLCIFASVLARVSSSGNLLLSQASGVFWLAAFAGFVWVYGPLLTKAHRPQPQ